MTALIVLIFIAIAYLAGSAHSNYRHGRAMGKSGISLAWHVSRGPFAKVPNLMIVDKHLTRRITRGKKAP